MESIVRSITRSAAISLTDPAFKSWLKSQSPAPNDLILINNSFVYREVATSKNEQYLGFQVTKTGALARSPVVAKGLRINSDFKLISSKASNYPAIERMPAAVDKQLRNLGILVFILIGRVRDKTILRQPVASPHISEIIWDPSLPQPVDVKGKALLVSDVTDEEAIWSTLAPTAPNLDEATSSALRDAIGFAIDKLRDEAVATLFLPGKGPSSGTTMTDAIVEVLRKHRDTYKTALSVLAKTNGKDTPAQTEVLRIAYNFATDATTFLRLVVSICDLKPIVLWGTIASHHKLSEAFRALPWTRSRVKASLSNYVSIVSDARNSAFHNLFPFRKSLDVDLPDKALRSASLRLFSEYAKKGSNQLRFQDKELVQVLFEFTRARYRRASLHFWQQNLSVMEAAISLFANTGTFLLTLHRATKAK